MNEWHLYIRILFSRYWSNGNNKLKRFKLLELELIFFNLKVSVLNKITVKERLRFWGIPKKIEIFSHIDWYKKMKYIKFVIAVTG